MCQGRLSHTKTNQSRWVLLAGLRTSARSHCAAEPGTLKGVVVIEGSVYYYGWSAAMAEKDAFSTILNILCTWTNDKAEALRLPQRTQATRLAKSGMR